MTAIVDYLDKIEDILEEAKSFPFSSKIHVDKDDLLDILGEIRLNLPNEIRQAQRIIDEYDKIIQEAKDRGSAMIKDAEKQCEKLSNEHEVYVLAVQKANALMDEAKQSARDVQMNAMSYADNILSRTETMLKEAMISYDKQTRTIDDHFSNLIETLYRNRKEIKGESGLKE